MQLLTIALLAAAASSVADAARKSHTAFTKPIQLGQGGVSNDFHILPIPKGPIAVYRFAADIVEIRPDGTVVPTPNYDAYLHHHVVGSRHAAYKHKQSSWSPMKQEGMYAGVGFGAGTESRGTPQEFSYPYAFMTADGEDEWIANVHIINTRAMPPARAHHCLECPCTSTDVLANGTVNGYELGLRCNAQLLHEKNTACFAETYRGGLRCCNDRELCLETKDLDATAPTSTYYMRYTIDYDEVVDTNRQLYLAACCDASGDVAHHGAVEYDIPPCDVATNPGCTHTLSTVQAIGRGGGAFGFGADFNATDDVEVELVYAVGHQHRGGLGIELYDAKTDELLCISYPTYGSGNVAGNESGYIVAMSHCSFDPPRRMRSTDIVRIVATYNNTVGHTGAMSLWYLAIADYKPHDEVKTSSVSGVAVVGGLFVAALLGAVAVVLYKRRQATRAGYEKVVETTPVVSQ
ncbi:Aste57867_19862 [Aphanomyces stellatus]|uniref:Aste57867_19862 protein n=1 Tax=Aphanomyces stellatus TaxID=120398 RepID=A0A485LES8_9STRA|nr:hypothetical protein As57867_019796 [Aphanomyces stellatus]VFT96560.1 Aste57867_19862 [Aphanomyces stellatus]